MAILIRKGSGDGATPPSWTDAHAQRRPPGAQTENLQGHKDRCLTQLVEKHPEYEGKRQIKDLDQNLEGEKAILIRNGSGLGAEITSEERILIERAASR